MPHRPSPLQNEPPQHAEAVDTGEQRLLKALSDPVCRQILQATSEQAMTATELAEALGLPRSTIYRKLEILGETPVVEEANRVSSAGRHASEYRAVVGRIQITLSASDDTVLTVDRYTDPE